MLLNCSLKVIIQIICLISFLDDRTGELGNLTAPCNAGCNCFQSYYYPVCGGDGVQYFSPCFAGCKNSLLKRQPKVTWVFCFTLMRQCVCTFMDDLLCPSSGVMQYLSVLPLLAHLLHSEASIKFQSSQMDKLQRSAIQHCMYCQQ